MRWVRALPPRAVDAGIALLCYLATVLPKQSNPTADGRELTLALAALASIPLVWRRQFPVQVMAVCGVGTVSLALTDGLGDLPWGQLVATYTVAALSGAVARLVGALGTTAGIAVTFQPLSEKLAQLPIILSLFVAAWALGTGNRARRDRIALLEERARRQMEEHESAAARERARIAREMHDIVAHSISLIAVQAEAGPVLVRADPDRAVRVFDTIGGTARETLTQLRRTLGVLRGEAASRAPQPDLDDLPALADSAREAGLAVSVEHRGEPRTLPPDLGLTAYRVVQESLTNVVRHAAASHVWISLDWAGDRLGLEVRDDGKGPGTRASGASFSQQGHGIAGMRERVSAFGGEFDAGNDPAGSGFRVVARLPVSRDG
ncbi:sensor histidine kinase [Micromonospora sp. CPCC 205371]|nr:sensor histidine kinase [Micromonospora sp. CPCC 205371]